MSEHGERLQGLGDGRPRPVILGGYRLAKGLPISVRHADNYARNDLYEEVKKYLVEPK